MLTARADEEAAIEGLLAGADYVTKPFSPRELVARIHGQLQRARARAIAAREQAEAVLREGGRS